MLSVTSGAPYRVRRLIKEHVDMKFREVRCMLRLPMPKRGLRAACNFAVADTLLDLIAGTSVVLYY